MSRQRPYRIGTGAGFSPDRLDPAIDLVKRGRLDAIVFECVGNAPWPMVTATPFADPSAG
ncbi:MAG: hypothetical protein Ct9H300mP16_00220 [Pseudomonadota bacterium]|nr:MAG: hypothetical protein Ct9H300mP16_00220 [Pseudomonadota bacterium]